MEHLNSCVLLLNYHVFIFISDGH